MEPGFAPLVYVGLREDKPADQVTRDADRGR
jgi:hypothetical protein